MGTYSQTQTKNYKTLYHTGFSHFNAEPCHHLSLQMRKNILYLASSISTINFMRIKQRQQQYKDSNDIARTPTIRERQCKINNYNNARPTIIQEQQQRQQRENNNNNARMTMPEQNQCNNNNNKNNNNNAGTTTTIMPEQKQCHNNNNNNNSAITTTTREQQQPGVEREMAGSFFLLFFTTLGGKSIATLEVFNFLFINYE